MKIPNSMRIAALLAVMVLATGMGTSARAAFPWSSIALNGRPNISRQLQSTISQQPVGEVGFTFRNHRPIDSFITQLIGTVNPGSFRVSTRLQGIGDDDGSDSYVTAVPEPETILAGLLLLVPFAFSTVQFLRNKNHR